MSPLRLRSALRHSRRRLAILLVMLGLAGAVAAHHSMPMDMHSVPGQMICLAVLGGVALLAAGAAVSVVPRPFPRLTTLPAPPSIVVPSVWSVPARAGPLYPRLSVLRL